MLETKEYAAKRLRAIKRAWEKERYSTDLAYRAKRKARCARRHAVRYATDEAYREKLRAAGRLKRNP
jgi:hypothetical protein